MHDIHCKSGSFGMPASVDCDSWSMTKIDKVQWHRYCSHIRDKEPPTIIGATGSQTDREGGGRKTSEWRHPAHEQYCILGKAARTLPLRRARKDRTDSVRHPVGHTQRQQPAR